MKQRNNTLQLRPLALSIACIGMAPSFAQMIPPTIPDMTIPVAMPGGLNGVAIRNGTPAAAMQLDQTLGRAVANWNSFSIGSKASVNVNQPIGGILLNRVVGTDPSTIFGSLTATGTVFLVNPAGVLFAPGSTVNVGGLVASTLAISDENFTNSKFIFSGASSKSVENQGSIVAAAKGTVALVGAVVRNDGTINVAQGSAGLISGSTVTVDFQGDGLTTFKVPAEAATASVVNKGTVQADGGHIVLMANVDKLGSAVVNQGGTLIAKSMQSRNGEIVLDGGGQGGVVQVGGTLDASAADAQSSGGAITTKGYTVTVDPAVSINARGGQNGANGSWTLTADTDLRVRTPDETFGFAQLSTVDTKTVGDTLGKGTNVILESKAAANGDSPGYGVVFAENSQVLKDAGGTATLTVNSQRNIVMENGASIVSNRGALNLNFDSDSAGSDAPPAILTNGTVAQRGAIVLGTAEIPTNEDGSPTMGATIQTNGGNINFYGQGKPLTGRAVGDLIQVPQVDAAPTTRLAAGIELNRSTVSTCAMGQDSCSGGGSISMRGQGQSTEVAVGAGIASAGSEGVLITGSAVTTGAGNIAIQGRGGLNASGIDSSATFFDGGESGNVVINTGIHSATGDISLVGSSRSLGAGDPLPNFVAAGSGITIDSTTIATGGNVTLDGTAADISAIPASAANVGNFYEAGTGVLLSGSDISAGNGKALKVLGTTGSQEFQIVGSVTAPALQTNYGNAYAVDIGVGRMTAPGGNLTIDGRGGNVRLDACCGSIGGAPVSVAGFNEDEIGVLLSTASSTGTGGNILVQGRNILMRNGDGSEIVALDSSGAGKGGTINVHAIGAAGPESSGVLALDNTVVMVASASGTAGDGGSITAKGDNTIKAHGIFEAKAGAGGGNGGQIETSGGAFDLQGILVDASAPAGKAGTWLIDPYNVTIDHGFGGGGLGGDVFTPLVDSTIFDGDINNALVTTSVTINTGTGGPAGGGFITMNGVQIAYAGDAGPRTFTLNANRGITVFGSTIAGYGADPLNVVLNADANNAATSTGGGSASLFNSTIYSNGGNVSMKGTQGPQDFDSCAVCIAGSTIDTRAGNTVTAFDGESGLFTFSGGDPAGLGGNVSLIGRDSRTSTDRQASGAVLINGSVIDASTGNVDVLGTSTIGSGIVVTTNQIPTGIFTTSGGITLTGVGSFAPNSASRPGHGVVIDASTTGITSSLQSVDGNITVNGLRLASAADAEAEPGNGVLLGSQSLVSTSGAGNITITGESQGNGAGILIEPAVPNPFTEGPPLFIDGGRVSGNNVVVLRAANDGSTDALQVGAQQTGPTVSAATVLNLRPGGVDLQGAPDAYVATAVDRTALPMFLGGSAAQGFAVGADDLALLQAPTIVAGSNAHAGDINVVGPLLLASNLTLQNGGGGNINLNAPVSVPQLGLISGGNITQSAGAPITANKLLALSSGGNVVLDNPSNNVSADTVGGGAAGSFTYVDADSVAIGAVTVTGFDAAGNLPQPFAATSMAADQVLVRTLSGDLVLATNLSSTTSADLVAAATFQNPGNFSITGGPWRIWADTWIGETRGGLAGSAPLPNYYNCAYLGLCTVTVSTTGNHFIYAKQPSATVTIDDATRVAGRDNPAFTFSVTGLILGDTNDAFSGTVASAADRTSPAGFYSIDGINFISPAGYAFSIVPGRLRITEAPIVPVVVAARRTDFTALPKPDVVREEPTTYLYDRNIGQAPICLATGPLDGDRADQSGDVLAREWSRVRSRPNLLSCVNTERRNGCADF